MLGPNKDTVAKCRCRVDGGLRDPQGRFDPPRTECAFSTRHKSSNSRQAVDAHVSCLEDQQHAGATILQKCRGVERCGPHTLENCCQSRRSANIIASPMAVPGQRGQILASGSKLRPFDFCHRDSTWDDRRKTEKAPKPRHDSQSVKEDEHVHVVPFLSTLVSALLSFVRLTSSTLILHLLIWSPLPMPSIRCHRRCRIRSWRRLLKLQVPRIKAWWSIRPSRTRSCHETVVPSCHS